MHTTIGERVLTIRKRLKLTQKQFGEKLRVSNAHISNIEKGHDVPSDSLIRLIAIEYSINEEWLRTGKGKAEAERRSLDFLTGDEKEQFEQEIKKEQEDLKEDLLAAYYQNEVYNPLEKRSPHEQVLLMRDSQHSLIQILSHKEHLGDKQFDYLYLIDRVMRGLSQFTEYLTTQPHSKDNKGGRHDNIVKRYKAEIAECLDKIEQL
ncbi:MULTISPECIES: helix-turn-helix domain-containing protein [Paenibacillaceae]|uniref:HTH cro/C1-type domain-containing protein n=2 Tax=Paenibacillaceae TaxID=186822 RepID=A0A511VB32_9BACL|nr:MULTISPECIES: helix-turn-helix transcriptional regulator [Paenibacillaceae]MUG72718.1 helix-turn-helix domain-containing protein [Paenibacillus validus]GEN36140.1 hypothetical protein ADA01nite_36000 [Aneurinibacillus danicus]